MTFLSTEYSNREVRGSSARQADFGDPLCLSRRRRSSAATGVTGGIKAGLSSATHPNPTLTFQPAGSIRFTSHKYARRRRDGSPFQHRAAAHGGGVSGSGLDRQDLAREGRKRALRRTAPSPATRTHSGDATGAAAGSSSTTSTTASTVSTGGLHRH